MRCPKDFEDSLLHYLSCPALRAAISHAALVPPPSSLADRIGISRPNCELRHLVVAFNMFNRMRHCHSASLRGCKTLVQWAGFRELTFEIAKSYSRESFG